jgi:hypothetical protein
MRPHILLSTLVESSCAGGCGCCHWLSPSGRQASRRIAGGAVLGSHGTVSAGHRETAAQVPRATVCRHERLGDRECQPPLSRETRGSGGEIRARIGHQIWDSSTLPQLTGLVPKPGQDCQSVRIYVSYQCPRQDSNLRSRLRRGLLCRPLTSGNEFSHTMIGGASGAARRTWAAGHAERGQSVEARRPVSLASGCSACGVSPGAVGTCD